VPSISVIQPSSPITVNINPGQAVKKKSINTDKENSRQYREEWKLVKNDEKATEDRMKNLIIDASDPWGMWCLVCTKWASQISTKCLSNFVKSAKNFQPPRRKKESVDIHFSSMAHSRCIEKEKSTLIPAQEAIIYKKITSLDENVQKKMASLIRTVFYFAVKDRPASDFSSECLLQKLNGVILGETYQNQISFAMLLNYTALHFKHKLVDNIRKSKFITLLTDGSTTKKCIEYEAVLVKYIPENEINSKMSFLGLCDIENATSEGLAKAISECLNQAGIPDWQERLISLTVDGASVNIGKHKGLVNMLESPTHIHCYNHLLDLCLKDALNNSAMASKTIALLRSINTFYRSSPKLTRELKRAAVALDIKLLSFKPICDTRWANSLQSSLIAVLDNYESIVQHLTNIVSQHASGYTSNVKSSAKSILKDLLMYDTVHFCYALRDFLDIVSKVSLQLEKENINICDATDCIKNLKLDIVDFGSSGELIRSQSRHLHTFLVTINDDDADTDIVKFKNIELGLKKLSHKKRKNTQISEDKNSFFNLCQRMSETIEQKFFGESGPCNSVCVRMAQKFDTVMFPPTDSELKGFGEDELLKVCDAFSLPFERALSEWKTLRPLMFENFKPSISLTNLYEKLNTDKFSSFKILKDLIQGLLTISPSNAAVERIWSNVKNIINDRSTSMKKEIIENRLIIKNAKVSLEEFNPDSVIELWWNDSIRSRRPYFND
jgi:hypothetical protein